jgi:hypothetical protein
MQAETSAASDAWDLLRLHSLLGRALQAVVAAHKDVKARTVEICMALDAGADLVELAAGAQGRNYREHFQRLDALRLEVNQLSDCLVANALWQTLQAPAPFPKPQQDPLEQSEKANGQTPQTVNPGPREPSAGGSDSDR